MADVSILSIAQDVDTVWHWNSDQYCHNDSCDERREVVSTTINRYAGDGDYGFFSVAAVKGFYYVLIEMGYIGSQD